MRYEGPMKYGGYTVYSSRYIDSRYIIVFDDKSINQDVMVRVIPLNDNSILTTVEKLPIKTELSGYIVLIPKSHPSYQSFYEHVCKQPQEGIFLTRQDPNKYIKLSPVFTADLMENKGLTYTNTMREKPMVTKEDSNQPPRVLFQGLINILQTEFHPGASQISGRVVRTGTGSLVVETLDGKDVMGTDRFKQSDTHRLRFIEAALLSLDDEAASLGHINS